MIQLLDFTVSEVASLVRLKFNSAKWTELSKHLAPD